MTLKVTSMQYRGFSAKVLVIVSFLAVGLLPAVDAEDDNPYAKTFDDFQWDENEERVAIAGSIPLGSKFPTLDVIALYEQRNEINPADVAGLSMLGKLYFRHAKEADDLPYYKKAAETLERAIKLQPNYTSAKLGLAEVYGSQHRFKDGLRLATEVLASDGNLPLAIAIASDCQLELGRYEDAKASLDTLLNLEASPPVHARLARYAELHGKTDQALALLDKAVLELEKVSAEPEDFNWYLWRKASLLFGRGDLAAAKQLHKQVLAVDGNDSAALFGLAEVHRAEGDTLAAMKVVQKIIDIDQAPPAMALMGDLCADNGNAEAAEAWYQKTESAMRAELVIAGDAHAREVALFFADHRRNLADAVSLAVKDLDRREDIYTYDTLAWCRFQAGDVSQATDAMKKALSLGTQDAKLFYHAAKIFAAGGDSSAAETMLARAKKLNPHIARQFNDSPTGSH